MSKLFENMVVKCNDRRPCFGKQFKPGECGVLNASYPDGECPFCKERREITDQKFYPYDVNYVARTRRR